MTYEEISLTIKRFKDVNERKTCSVGASQEKTCPFLKFRQFGQIGVCCVENKDLSRRMVNGEEIGTLIPLSECYVWKENNTVIDKDYYII